MSEIATISKRTDKHCRIEFSSTRPKFIRTPDRGAPFNIPHTRWWKGEVKPSRDSQRKKAYRAEDAALPLLDQKRFESLPQVACYLRDLISTEWFQRRWPEFTLLDIYYIPNKRAASANARDLTRSTGGWIKFGPWSLGNRPGRVFSNLLGGEWIVLHELAHAIAPRGHSHDALWARIYLELVKFKMGTAAHDALSEQFREKKVRYKPARQMTEVQRAAAAERLKHARAKKESTHAA